MRSRLKPTPKAAEVPPEKPQALNEDEQPDNGDFAARAKRRPPPVKVSSVRWGWYLERGYREPMPVPNKLLKYFRRLKHQPEIERPGRARIYATLNDFPVAVAMARSDVARTQMHGMMVAKDSAAWDAMIKGKLISYVYPGDEVDVLKVRKFSSPPIYSKARVQYTLTFARIQVVAGARKGAEGWVPTFALHVPLPPRNPDYDVDSDDP